MNCQFNGLRCTNLEFLCNLCGDKDKEITQLKKQIEKTKCCGNCEHYYCSNDTKGKCKLLNSNVNKCGFNICAKWELAE